MKFNSHFVAKDQDPYRLVSWKKVDCQIQSQGQSDSSKVHFSMKNVEAPESWSQTAVEIAAAKYFRKVGVGSANGSEKSVRQMIERVVQAIVKAGQGQKYFSTPADALRFGNELKYILLTQRALFNSPVWFNCGLYNSYKIKGEASLWAWDFRKKTVALEKHSYVRPQVSACFIQKVEDSLESIFDLAKNEARLFKFGSGSGTNFSSLRSRHEQIEGGGTSSGLISFLEVLDRGAASIKSGGVTRRAAKMVCLDVDHPEVIDFIRWKKLEEQKAHALIAAGYSGEFEGEAYRSVSGQNANNSVRVSDQFMKAVLESKDWVLKGRSGKTKGKAIQRLPAKEIWQELTEAAFACADPGLQFNDTINKWHTCPESGEIRASNPCSEYMFLDDSACNLASLNLLPFLDVDGGFDLESYLHTTHIMFVAQDILVDMAGYPTAEIAKNSHQFRPLGLGFCGLGAFLMRKGLSYNSQEGRNWSALLAALLGGQAYLTSCELAHGLGAFPAFGKNKKSFLKVLRRHRMNADQLATEGVPGSYLEIAQNIWDEVEYWAAKSGVRNAQTTVMAPTGTIGLVLDADTTGVEPEFSLVRNKKLSGGGSLRLVSSSVAPALEKLGYTLQQTQAILEFIEAHACIEGAPGLKAEHLAVFDCAQKNGQAGQRCLPPESHLQMMQVIQPFLSGAISKTVNLPAEATVADISDIYMKAWQMGIKSISIYIDASKRSQPLNKEAPRRWKGDPTAAPLCPDCGARTELAGGCFRCVNCGTTLGCS